VRPRSLSTSAPSRLSSLTLAPSSSRADHDATSYLWETWSDAELRAWAVKEKLVGATDGSSLRRHQLEQLAKDNYGKTKDAMSSSFDEHSMRGWLIKHGVIKSDAQKKKDEVRLSSSFTCSLDALVPDLELHPARRSRPSSASTTPTRRARRPSTSRGATPASARGCATPASPSRCAPAASSFFSACISTVRPAFSPSPPPPLLPSRSLFPRPLFASPSSPALLSPPSSSRSGRSY